MYALKKDPQDDHHARVLTLLEAEHLHKGQRRHYGRRQLSAGALAAMWGLRIYAILMVIVVIYSVVQAVQSGT